MTAPATNTEGTGHDALERGAQESYGVFAMEKLIRVLGETRALSVYLDTLAAAGLTEIDTADDLYAFGQQLSKRDGFEAAVGGLLSVAALLRGATGSHG